MRTHYCGELDETLVGSDVVLCGWVHHRRDHGGVAPVSRDVTVFVHALDAQGALVALVCNVLQRTL